MEDAELQLGILCHTSASYRRDGSIYYTLRDPTRYIIVLYSQPRSCCIKFASRRPVDGNAAVFEILRTMTAQKEGVVP